MKRRMKVELISALAVAVTLACLAVYTGLPGTSEIGAYLHTRSTMGIQSSSGVSTQQIVLENIQGELRKGEFETTVQGVKNLASGYAGKVPTLHLSYENDVWTGTLTCKVPVNNVTLFTFDVRKLIDDHGKVTHVSIDVNEIEANQNQSSGTPVSEVSIYLYEHEEGTSPFLSQLGAIVPLLTTALVWIAEGLIIGVPLCFASLGIVVLVDRGIVPVWKKQLRNRSLTKERTESASS